MLDASRYQRGLEEGFYSIKRASFDSGWDSDAGRVGGSDLDPDPIQGSTCDTNAL